MSIYEIFFEIFFEDDEEDFSYGELAALDGLLTQFEEALSEEELNRQKLNTDESVLFLLGRFG